MRSQVLALYRALLKQGAQFPQYNVRAYVQRRVREDFHKHANASQSDVAALVRKAEDTLKLLQRQSVVYSLYTRPFKMSYVFRHFRDPFHKTPFYSPCRPGVSHLTTPSAESLFRLCASVESMTQELKTHEETLKRVFEGESSVTTPKQPRKKKRESPVSVACHFIFSAAKQNDRHSAMQQFRQARDDGLHLPQSVMNSVLYLLVGGESWYERAVTNATHGPSPAESDLQSCKDEVLEYMEQRQLKWDEVVYLTQARLSAVLGDPEAALRFAEQMVAQFPAKLRFFTPALIGFSERGEMEKALHIQRSMDRCELDLTELEFRLLLTACSAASGSYPHISSLLKRMGKELTFLQRDTIDVVQRYFNSVYAKEAFGEGGMSERQLWMVDEVEVDSEGFVLTAGEKLSASDLAESDWQLFLKAFEELALRQEAKAGPFREFMAWMDRHGPFPLVLDGANVAFHKQNYDQGGFSFAQIRDLVDYLTETFPGTKILVVLHLSRTRGRASKDPMAQAFLAKLQSNNQLFVTPVGSNDDWYWLYAALHAREAGRLVSNDECRDHIFQLLAPKYFLKWKERHLVRYEFQNGVPTIQLPPVYTSCTQQLSNGTWMLPHRDSEGVESWLCARPL